ncbi:unnamed protein product [Allacma fusca]|uniref:Uncharacterized protein n=1 Tax=Allacma fusca TaxID=39272 RepID=A0A8J2L0R5_9HEXA|nr:unnamed protein product [Allacma fusca]
MNLQPPQPIRSGTNNNVLRCPMVNCPFYCRSYCNYEGHLETRHFCIDCANYMPDSESHECHKPGQRMGYVDAGAKLDLTDFYEYSRSHGGSMISYKYKHSLNKPDIEATFAEVEPATSKLLKELYAIHTLSKVEISIGVQMEKEVIEENGSKGYKQALIYFKSLHHELETPASIHSILLQSASDIIEKKNTFVENGSGWNVQRIESFEIKLGEIRLFANSKASGHLQMPFKHRQGYTRFQEYNRWC